MSLEDLVSELRTELAGATSVTKGLQSSVQQQQAQITEFMQVARVNNRFQMVVHRQLNLVHLLLLLVQP